VTPLRPLFEGLSVCVHRWPETGNGPPLFEKFGAAQTLSAQLLLQFLPMPLYQVHQQRRH
jgi:hypothetical protein